MTSFSTSIAASSDDARETVSTGVVDLTINNHNIFGAGREVGLRFQNVTISAGSTITNAWLTVTTYNTEDDPNVTIYGEDIDDAPSFTTTGYDITSRTKTTASVSWSASNIGTGAKNSPDVKSVIQEIIDRSGWASGNDIAIIVQGVSGCNFSFRAYDYGSDIPSITIEYTEPASGGANPKTARIRLTTKVGGVLIQ